MVNNSSFFVRFLFLVMLWVSCPKVLGQCYEIKLKPVLKNGKYGAVDIKTGKLLIKHKFSAADSFPGNYMLVAREFPPGNQYTNSSKSLRDHLVKPENKIGLVNEKGKLVLPMVYQQILPVACQHFQVKKAGKNQLLDPNFRIIYEDTANFQPNLITNQVIYQQKLDNLTSAFKIKDISTGNVIYQKQATEIKPLNNSSDPANTQKQLPLPYYVIQMLRLIESKTDAAVAGTSSIIDRTGKTILDSVEYFNVQNGLIQVKRKGQQIFADPNFRIYPEISYKYANVWPIKSPAKWFLVRDNGKDGVIDIKGKVLLPFTDQGSYQYVGKNAFLYKSNKDPEVQNLLFMDGRTLDLSNYSNIKVEDQDTTFLNHPFVFTDKGTDKMGLTDLNGKVILPAIYDNLFYTSCKALFYTKGDELGFLSADGKEMFSGQYRAISVFEEGIAAAMLNTPEGSIEDFRPIIFIDSSGKVIPGGPYSEVSLFKGGVAQVMRDGKSFMIDKKGQPVNFGKYKLQSHFNGNIAIIANKTETKFGLADKRGKIIVKPTFEAIETEDALTNFCVQFLFKDPNFVQPLSPLKIPVLQEGNIEVTMKIKGLNRSN